MINDTSIISPARAAVNHELDILDASADKWAEDINLCELIKNLTSTIDLINNAPPEVIQKFRLRMESHIDSIIRQAFVEGAYRAITALKEELGE